MNDDVYRKMISVVMDRKFFPKFNSILETALREHSEKVAMQNQWLMMTGHPIATEPTKFDFRPVFEELTEDFLIILKNNKPR